MMKFKLHDVYGISRDIPKITYVDRASLDELFGHYLSGQKHIVLHGASKQGKSCLRKKNLDPGTCVVVQCLPAMEDTEIWATALQQLNADEVTEKSISVKSTDTIEGKLKGRISIPTIVGIQSDTTAGHDEETCGNTKKKPIYAESYLTQLCNALHLSGKHLVLEDFHYLPDETRIRVAFGLKALYEEGVYVVVIGIWSEQNLLTYYNGDLTGRTEEINLIWSDGDLKKVIELGEVALNISFTTELKLHILQSSFQNVGLLQRIAEKICLEAKILETQTPAVRVDNYQFLEKARELIVADIRQRYTRIAQVFVEGMRADSQLHLYGRIYNELICASDTELMSGISIVELLKRMQGGSDKEIRQSDLTQSLERIEKLQASRRITPLLVSYSKSLRTLFLNDREFLFYRRYSGDDPEDLKVIF